MTGVNGLKVEPYAEMYKNLFLLGMYVAFELYK